jgi:hypothetical protein
VEFGSMTYQELLSRLHASHESDSAAYIDYLVRRYGG